MANPNAGRIPLPAARRRPRLNLDVVAETSFGNVNAARAAYRAMGGTREAARIATQYMMRGRVEEQEQEMETEWLRSSARWIHGVGLGWQPTRVLGSGSYGIVGQWTYKGDNTNSAEWANKIQHIAVKQGSGETLNNGERGFKAEARFLQSLAGCPHIPRMYRHLYREKGQGTPGLQFDDPALEVHRIFLEYCEGGDLNRILKEIHSRKIPPLNEAKLWSMFKCLAKALMALERGHEIPDSNMMGEDRAPIVHFDIKPGNILIKSIDGTEHTTAPLMKLSDFGLAANMPAIELQDMEFINNFAWKCTRGFGTPEQRRDGGMVSSNGQTLLRRTTQVDSQGMPVAPLLPYLRKYGSHTNVYMVGCVMWCLVMTAFGFPQHAPFYKSQLNDRLKTKETTGSEIETRNISDSLKALILECLIQEYPSRIKVDDLLTRVESGLDASLSIVNWSPNNEVLMQQAAALTDAVRQVKTPVEWNSPEPPDLWEIDLEAELRDVRRARRRERRQAEEDLANQEGLKYKMTPEIRREIGRLRQMYTWLSFIEARDKLYEHDLDFYKSCADFDAAEARMGILEHEDSSQEASASALSKADSLDADASQLQNIQSMEDVQMEDRSAASDTQMEDRSPTPPAQALPAQAPPAQAQMGYGAVTPPAQILNRPATPYAPKRTGRYLPNRRNRPSIQQDSAAIDTLPRPRQNVLDDNVARRQPAPTQSFALRVTVWVFVRPLEDPPKRNQHIVNIERCPASTVVGAIKRVVAKVYKVPVAERNMRAAVKRAVPQDEGYNMDNKRELASYGIFDRQTHYGYEMEIHEILRTGM